MRDDTNNVPAFPRPAFASGTLESMPQEGMTLRDYFAGQALAGLLSGVDEPHEDVIAVMAYDCADAMLKARQ